MMFWYSKGGKVPDTAPKVTPLVSRSEMSNF